MRWGRPGRLATVRGMHESETYGGPASRAQDRARPAAYDRAVGARLKQAPRRQGPDAGPGGAPSAGISYQQMAEIREGPEPHPGGAAAGRRGGVRRRARLAHGGPERRGLRRGSGGLPVGARARMGRAAAVRPSWPPSRTSRTATPCSTSSSGWPAGPPDGRRPEAVPTGGASVPPEDHAREPAEQERQAGGRRGRERAGGPRAASVTCSSKPVFTSSKLAFRRATTTPSATSLTSTS